MLFHRVKSVKIFFSILHNRQTGRSAQTHSCRIRAMCCALCKIEFDRNLHAITIFFFKYRSKIVPMYIITLCPNVLLLLAKAIRVGFRAQNGFIERELIDM